jgi:hypothetical protein
MRSAFFLLCLAACVASPDSDDVRVRDSGAPSKPSTLTAVRPSAETQEDLVAAAAGNCVVVNDGPEALVFTPRGPGGLALGAKRQADGSLLYFFLLDAQLPADWRRRLQQKSVLGTPVWTIDGGASVHFDLESIPAIDHYAVTFYEASNNVGRTMTEDEFTLVRNAGLTIDGLVLTHQNRRFSFPARGQLDATIAQGLAVRIRELRWR